MMQTIRDIAVIQSGVYVQGAPDGEVLYLQVKDFSSFGELQGSPEMVIIDEVKLSRHELCEGDLLFAAKGTSNFCVVYRAVMGKAVSSSSFFVIRITEARVCPEYLCWYLNSSKVLNSLKANAVGSSIPSITKPVLEEMELVIPTMDKQRLVVEIARLQRREIELHALIAQEKKVLTDRILINSIK